MIYRLFRKEVSVRSTLDLAKPQLSESLFIEEISRMIKLVKKRDRLCLELEEGMRSGEEGQREASKMQGEADEILSVLRGFCEQSYFARKAYTISKPSYLYTAFMRVAEIADKGRTRLRTEASLTDRSPYEDLKKAITELYNRQAGDERYDVVELFDLVLRQQTLRIAPFLPRKKPAPLQPISNSSKLLDHLRRSDSLNLRKKCISTEMARPIQSKIQEIINRKLAVPSLATSKRIEERKKTKTRSTNLYKLYEILDVRPPCTLKEELTLSMNERNQTVREAIKKWQKRWAANRKEKR